MYQCNRCNRKAVTETELLCALCAGTPRATEDTSYIGMGVIIGAANYTEPPAQSDVTAE